MTASPDPSPSDRLALTRRQFLWWSAVLSGGAALPVAALPADVEPRPLGLGFVGLGRRGRRWLAAARATPEVRPVAICDPDATALRRAAGSLASAPRWVCRDSRGLFGRTDVDAVVIAAPPERQLELARDACAGGHDVLLDRPLAVDRDAARRLADLAQARRQAVHLVRERNLHGLPLAERAAGEPPAALAAEIHRRIEAPEGEIDTSALMDSLLDEVDFALLMLEGRPRRIHKVASRGLVPGCRFELRADVELAHDDGPRRFLHLRLGDDGPGGADGTGVVVLHGLESTLEIESRPVPRDQSRIADLAAFAFSLRNVNGAGPGCPMGAAKIGWDVLAGVLA